MNVLLILTAVFEGATGLLLLLTPALVLAFLVGWREVGPETTLVGRVAGAALLGLSGASWLARNDDSQARRGLLTGLLVYNVLVTVLLAYAGSVQHMAGLLLWPAVLSHLVLTAWSVACLRRSHEREHR